MADYAGACHRAALCADPVGSNPSYALQTMLRIARYARYGRVIMRILLVRGLALALLVTPNVVRAESAIVRSGVKSQITIHTALSSRTCVGYRIVIEILTAPTNGTLTTEPKNRVIPPVTSRGGQQPPQCVGKTAMGIAIFYQSKPGFVGQDSFKYRRSSPGDPRDPNAGDISYTVTVK
jgi:hypothetical protein